MYPVENVTRKSETGESLRIKNRIILALDLRLLAALLLISSSSLELLF